MNHLNQHSPYLSAVPYKVHRFWWTCIPALPRNRDTQAYHALKRVWFDHTINTFREVAPGLWQRRSRGFYTEGGEDHVTPALFQNWALFPNNDWVRPLLEAYQINVHGKVRRVRWCPFFEQVHRGKKFCIADIVFSWEDDIGIGVLVLEAKVRGGRLGSKDHPATSPYLLMPSIRAVPRRYYGLLIDSADMRAARDAAGHTAPIMTWQTLAHLQIGAAQLLPLRSRIVECVTDSLMAHFAYFGMSVDRLSPSQMHKGGGDDIGTADGYAEVRSLHLPASVEDYLIGTQVVMKARAGIMPEPPYAWLLDEPDSLSIYLDGKNHAPGYQTTTDRRVPRWSLDREI
jgi:hypothetical protein